jgi:hypothetical protein
MLDNSAPNNITVYRLLVSSLLRHRIIRGILNTKAFLVPVGQF